MNGSTGIESNRNNRIIMKNFTSIVGNKPYTVSVKNNSYQIVNGVFFNENYGYVTSVSAIVSQTNFTNLTFTAPSTAKYVKFYVRKSTDEDLTPSEITTAQIQLEQGSSATTYEEYIPKKIYTKNRNDVFEEFYNESEEEEKYSMTEQKIGTWIDNRPLYRKVITGTFLNNDGYTNILTNIDVVFLKSGIVYESSTTIRQLEYYHYYNTSNNDFDIVNVNHTVMYRAKSPQIQGKDFVFIIEYTKTTN